MSSPGLSDKLLERLPLGIAILNRGFGIEWANAGATALFSAFSGISPLSVIPGVGIFEFVPGLEASFIPLFERAFAGETIRRESMQVPSRNTVMYWDVGLMPHAENGRVESIALTLIDVTEHTRAADTPEKSKPQVQQPGISNEVQGSTKQVRGRLAYQIELLEKLYNSLAAGDKTAGQLRDREPGKPTLERVLFQADLLYKLDDVVIATDTDLIINAWNRAAERMYGWTAAEVIGRWVSDVIRTDLGDAQRTEALQQIEQTDHYHIELVQYDRHGNPLQIEGKTTGIRDTAGVLIGYVTIARDISRRKYAEQALQRAQAELEQRVVQRTEELSSANQQLRDEIGERKRVEEALREGEERFRRYFELGLIGLAITSPTKGILEVNDELCKILGYERDELLQLTWAELTHPSNLAADLALFNRVLAGEIDGYSMDKRWIRKDGAIIDATISVKCLRRSDGTVDYFVAMLQDITARKQAEELLQRAHAELEVRVQERTEQLSELNAELSKQVAERERAEGDLRQSEEQRQIAALVERQRLARELHDSVTQVLYGIALAGRTARHRIERAPERAIEPLDSILSLTDAALAEMRAIVFELRPESLESEGLVAALRKQADYVSARYNIQVQTVLDQEPNVSLDIKQALYRIAQQALENTIRHANATRVELELKQTPKALVLGVADNGAGFDASQTFPGHLGLRSMRERAAQFGGTFEIESAPTFGTHIRVEIPL